MKDQNTLHHTGIHHPIAGSNSAGNQISAEVAMEGLRTAIMLLETELSVLEHRRASMYKTLNTFRIRYNATLGMLLGDILRLRLEQYRRLRDSNPDKEQLAAEAEEDLHQHRKSMHEVKDEIVATLSRQKDKELQQKFHKASKLCHPDLVDDAQKDRATEIFADLNNAYYHNNLKRVSEILTMLEQSEHGLTGKSSGLSTRELLVMHETRLRFDIDKLKQDISGITSSAPYKFLEGLEDWDQYFETMKMKLTHERDELESLLEDSVREDER